MSGLLRHARARATALLRDPLALFYLLVAAASSLYLFPAILAEWPVTGEGRLAMQLLGLVLWPWLLSLAALARVERSDYEPFPSQWTLPALPVGPSARLLGEALVVLLLLILLRLPAHFLGEGGRELLAGAVASWPEAPYGLRVLAAALRGALLFLPLLLAWSAPTKSKGWYFARPLAVAAILFLGIEAGLAHRPAALVGVSLALSAAVLLTAGWEPRRRARPSVRSGRPLRLARPGLEPHRRFLRDRWSRPLRLFGAPVALGFATLLTVALLERRGVVSRFLESGSFESDFFWGGGLGALLGILPLPLLYPVGVSIFKGARGGRPGSLAPGAYAEAWSVLPVPPEKVARAVYEHALLGGLILWGLVAIYAVAVHLAGVYSYRALLFFLPLVLAVPSGAGVLVGVAFGSTLRTAVSLACLLLFVPLQVGAEYLTDLYPFSLFAALGEPVARLLVCVILGLVLALVGGLPPLAYLRRDRAARGAAR
jgi:hypothetical protein